MRRGLFGSIELLETRRLLTSYGFDLSFGTAGAVEGANAFFAVPVAGGKILAVSDSGITRVTDSGQIDPSFPHVSYSDELEFVENGVESNNRIIIGGSPTEVGSEAFVSVKAFNLDGTAATAFNGTGTQSLDEQTFFGSKSIGGCSINGMAATSDGGVLVNVGVGFEDDTNELVVQKLDSDGSLDSGFGDQGTLLIPQESTIVSKILTLDSGKFVLLTAMPGTLDQSTSLTRYNADGTLDTTFGTQGTAALSNFRFGDLGSGPYLLEQADHSILIAGQTVAEDSNAHPLLAKLQADGSLDPSFGTDGVLQLNNGPGENVGIVSMTQDSQHRIVLADDIDELFRFNPDDTPDVTFGDNGIVNMNLPIPAFGTVTLGAAYLTTDSSDRILVSNEEGLVRIAPRVPIALANNTIYIDGTSGDDTIDVKNSGSKVQVTLNSTHQSFDASDVDSVNITTEAGDNAVMVSIDKDTTVIAGDGADTITTAGGDDSITSGEGNDSIHTEDGQDTIISGNGNDFLDSGDGPAFNSGDDSDSITAGNGNDTIHSGVGAAGIEVGTGDNNITTGDGDKFVVAHAGNTIVQMTGSLNTFQGQGGAYTVTINGSGSVFIVASTSLINITGSEGSKVTDDSGIDTINTGDGDDTINSTGMDTINSGDGNDLITHHHTTPSINPGSSNPVLINAGSGNDTVLGGDTPCTIHGGDGNDSIKTGDANDFLYGDAGSDTLRGGLGSDLLSGGGGRDHLLGQQGNDRIYAGNGDDAIDAGPGNDRIFGQAGDDMIMAGVGNDQLDGGPGSDYLAAGPGDDTLTANDGVVDSVYGGDGNDSPSIDAGIDLLRSIEAS